MKKVLCTILTLTLVFALAGCSGNNTPADSGSSAPADSGSSAPADSGQTASGEPQYVLKVGHDEATDGSYHYLCTYFADQVKEKTNGQVQIDVYPQSQLGSELELAEGLRIGTIDFAVGSVGNLTPLIPEGGLLGVPYIIESQEHLNKLIDPDGTFIKALSDKITSKNIGIVLLGLPTNGVRSIYNDVRPIYTPDDLKGLKIRVMTSDIQMKAFSAMGASPTAIAFNELYSAMQHKVVDGAENSPLLLWSMKHYECAKYLSLTEHMIATGLFMMSERTYENLPADLRDIVIEAAHEAVAKELEFDLEATDDALEKLKEWGVQVNEVDKQPFIDLTAHLHQEVAEQYDCMDLLEIIQKEAE